MDAGMAALRSQLDEAAHNLSISHRPHPPPAGNLASAQLPHPHPYAMAPPPHMVAPPPQVRMSAPPAPQGQPPVQGGGFAAELGNVMLTPEDKQEGYDSSLAYLAPRNSPPGPAAPLPPVPQSAPPIPSSVPRYQLSDGPATPPSQQFQQFHHPHQPYPPASMPHIQPGMVLPHPLSYPAPQPGYHAPVPLPLPATQGSEVGLSRKPSLTVSAQAAQAHPAEANGSPQPVPYRVHDSPMPFRSFNNIGGSPGPPGMVPYPHPHGHPHEHEYKSRPPPPMPLGEASDDSHEVIDIPGNPSSEKIRTDEVAAYRDIEDEEAERRKKKMKKGVLIGVVLLIVIAVIAAVVGVTVSKKKDSEGDKADRSRLEASASDSAARFGTSEVVFTSIATLTGANGEVSTTARAVTRSSAVDSSETTSTRTRATVSSSPSSSSSTTTTTTSTASPSSTASATLIAPTTRSLPSTTTTSTSSSTSASSTPTSGQVVTRPVPGDDDTASSTTSSTAVATPTIRPGRGNAADENDDEEEDGFNLFDPSTWGRSHRSLLRRRMEQHRRYRH